MSTGDYLEGLAFLAATVALCGLAAWRLVRGFAPQLAGVPRALALAVLATAALLAAHLLPGLAGILERATVLACAVLIAAVALAVSRRLPATAGPSDAWPRARPSSRASIAIAAIAIAVFAVFVLASLHLRAPTPISNTDALAFHLPGIGRWLQTGSVWRVDQFIPGLPTGQYPQNGDVLLASAILPWSNDAFVRFVNYGFLAVLALAVYAGGRELRAPAASAALFAALLVAVPAVNVPITDTVMTDAPMLAGLAAGVAFLIRHARTGRRSDLAIAALALGIAFGTKWYGVTGVPVVIAVWVIAMLAARTPWRTVLARAAALSAVVLAAGGVWLLRNLVESGNPFYPARVEIGGLTLFDAPRFPIVEQTGRTIAGYLDDPGVWADYLLGAWAEGLAAPALALVLGAGLALVLCVRRGPPTRRLIFPLAAAAAALGVVYVMLPGTAGGAEGAPVLATPNTRYLVPALVLAAPLGAWATGRAGRWRIAIELAALVAIADGIRQSFEALFELRPAGSFTFAAVAVVLAAAAYVGVPRLRARIAGPAFAALAAAACVVAVVGLGVAGHELQQRFNATRYAGADPSFDAATAAPASRVGIAGIWSLDGYAPPWPLFGPWLDNDVFYVGRDEDGKLAEYGDRERFIAALERGRYDLLVIGLGQVPRPRVIEEGWARAAGYDELGRSERLALYGAPGVEISAK